MAKAISCKSSSRLVRGGIGGVVGSLAGALVGFGVSAVMIGRAVNKGFSEPDMAHVMPREPGYVPPVQERDQMIRSTGTMMSVFALPGGALLGACLLYTSPSPRDRS